MFRSIFRVPSGIRGVSSKNFRGISSIINQRIPKGYTQPTPKSSDLIIIAMSSGVDSSVAALLYKQKYENCLGIFMENWSQLDNERCLEQDWKDVQLVGNQLNLPIERVNFEKDYWIEVFEPMLTSYNKGLTPNPDINCNKYVKFGSLINYVSKKYKDQNWWLVTGHYSRILQNDTTGELHLLRSYYPDKDQSYYLSQIETNVLSRVLLPIGHYTKPEIRKLAQEKDLVIADKKDSQGLCFVSQTQGNFNNFLKNFLMDSPGNIITEDGKIWGKHDGLWSLTLGQKCGISMPQGDPRYKGVWFVSEKNFETGDITIVKGGNNDKLFKKIVYVQDFIPLGDDLDITKMEGLTVQYRSLQSPISLKTINYSNGKWIFTLNDKARAISPGQYLAVYQGDRCLGSGVIEGAE
ncbi:tRNA-specific 2-thiouridylase mnmA [Wickerhamomyces ciferrii]|uniref:tRNA-5-taurinomethyluridine 2-sulfurtransferase n=1 Tax=Wickerhamomyces ciferrii (strain ATCC 14091 / BCRC 22168 / CBS 111 / JCM 3599 / NBRC 0793 / NRRL Y-1031 F-60-10) TaxID=1206466 RepID=K0KQF1_WICCF|nr:tRNA-specific 2-thiouridylase mnmA [Wickerhamomyces ciferrii]CCH43478.1 tRNA-specific 2-thiouridylase mnmA [Wickerhamomyces ciferrii]